ncbi:hypothetical protein R8G64_00910 [Tenacibaculum maritimum]|uniref:hypothetical protein n=1 Tax=Tenacibaculum maritimum TaxID=107401 RepID=UPI0013300047|nr:hypothetical protein [Tenacibaculum maritimum]
MKATELVIFKNDIVNETYYCLKIEGIGYVKIERYEAKRFKNRTKYEKTNFYKEEGFMTRDYKII